MSSKQEHKKAVDKTGKLKPKYRDIARYPKVQTDGYEKSFNDEYEGMIASSISEMIKEMK